MVKIIHVCVERKIIHIHELCTIFQIHSVITRYESPINFKLCENDGIPIVCEQTYYDNSDTSKVQLRRHLHINIDCTHNMLYNMETI